MIPYAAPNAEVKAFQEALREQWEPLWTHDPVTTPCNLMWEFARQLPRYESASGRMVTKHRQDLTNCVKSAEDAIQPWLIHNDVLVVRMTAVMAEQSADVTDPYVKLLIAWE